VFKPGKNRDGYFDAKALMDQVEHAINIFEGKANGHAQGLFLFDNAPSHLKRAPDAISASKMVKSAYFHVFYIFLVLIGVPKIRSVSGRITQRGHACAMASIP
jgi:hypothetical protein